MHSRRWVLIAFLAAICVAAVEAQQRINDPPTGLKESGCFGCHEVGGGAFGPPLVQMYAVQPPGNLSLPIGEVAPYDVDVVNAWTSLLLDIDTHIDLTFASSLGFASDIPPVRGLGATLPLQSTGTDREAQTTINVPAGMTDLIIRAVPGPALGVDLIPPDLSLRIWPSGTDVDGPPAIDQNDSPSGAETFHVRGAEVSRLGNGTWTVQAVQVDALLQGPAGLLPRDVRIEMDAWSNVTGERVQFLSTPIQLDGQDKDTRQTVPLPYRLLAEFPPGPQERLLVTVNVTAHYDHPGTTSGGLDDWRYTKTLEVSVLGGPEVDGPIDIVTGAPDEVPQPDTDPIPWDRIGEIVGYVSGFLMLISMVTGGVFGKGSRRFFNKVFRSAKRRVAFHNFISYLLTFFAAAHTVLFILEPGYPWTLGIIWGTVGLLCMLALGVTGAVQVPMVRRWKYATWRWTHFWLAIAALVFTIVHLLLDGANFTEVAEAVGWQDPFQ